MKYRWTLGIGDVAEVLLGQIETLDDRTDVPDLGASEGNGATERE